jgi:AraC family transcriptional regulator
MTASLALSARDEPLSLSGLRLTRTYRAPRLSLAKHSHECTNIALCVRGVFHETLGGTWHEVSPKTLISRPAGEPHANRYGPQAAWCLIFEVLPPAVDRIRPSWPMFQGPLIHSGENVAAMAARIDREFLTRDSLSAMAIESLFYELIVQVARQKETDRSRRLGWLDRARDLLHDRFLSDIDLVQIAEAAGVSPPHLCRSFRRYFHTTPGEYVRDLRIGHAIQLLKDGMPLAQVAIACGFYDQSHFSRAFKRRFGVPPAKFRKSLN